MKTSDQGTIQTGLRAIEYTLISTKELSKSSFDDRIGFLGKQIVNRKLLIIPGSIKDLFFDKSNYMSFDERSKLRLLIYSLPNCSGCSATEETMEKIGVNNQDGLIIGLTPIVFYLIDHFQLDINKHQVVTTNERGWKRDIDDIQTTLKLKESTEKVDDPPPLLGKNQSAIPFFDERLTDDELAVFKLATNENSYLIQQLSVLQQILIRKEGLKLGKIKYTGSKEDEAKNYERLIAFKAKIQGEIKQTLKVEIENHYKRGYSSGKMIAEFHSLNMIHGDLHKMNIKPPSGGEGGTILDLETSTLLLREPSVIERAGDLVTLFVELSSVEWRGFREGYIDVLKNVGRNVVNVLEKEVQA